MLTTDINSYALTYNFLFVFLMQLEEKNCDIKHTSSLH